MDQARIRELIAISRNELTNQIMYFWLPKCIDEENGGFYNGFDNCGAELKQTDKFIWGQARFTWNFCRMYETKAPILSKAEREEFGRLAKSGAEFIMNHGLVGDGSWLTTSWTDASGKAILVGAQPRLHFSTYTDMFCASSVAMYARVFDKPEAYAFAKNLYISTLKQADTNTYEPDPAQHPMELRVQALPMFLNCISKDVYEAALKFDPEFAAYVMERMKGFNTDILTHFVDDKKNLIEVLTIDNEFLKEKIGRYINNGHVMMSVRYMLEAIEITGQKELEPLIFEICKQALRNGWDEEFGGLVNYSGPDGGAPDGETEKYGKELLCVLLSLWDRKVQFVNCWAMFTTLLCYERSGDEEFLDWYNKIAEYTLRVFPNRDPEIREWIQNRERDGSAIDNSTAAHPTKDPYHIWQSLLLTLELLYRMQDEAQ